MLPRHSADEVPQDTRKEIFRALVETQDQGMNVSQSRAHVAQRFGVTEAQVRAIEREGIDGLWPPLD